MCSDRRGQGFNRLPLVCPTSARGPVAGYARTATIRSREPQAGGRDVIRARRLAYHRHVGEGPRPGIIVIQDADPVERRLGAFWGEARSHVHRAMGIEGLVTDGAIRDVEDWADGFLALAGTVMPSHVWAEVVSFGTSVSIAGMVVAPGDIVHADLHGAVVIPPEAVARIPAAAEAIRRREAILIGLAKAGPVTADDIAEALSRSDEIH